MILIANKRVYTGPGVYVGRPSLLGNPFKIGPDGNREQVVEKYLHWLRMQWKIGQRHIRDGITDSRPRAIVEELICLAEMEKRDEEIVLVCWCLPELCHAEIIAEAVKKIATWG